ncbi:serine/arginine repetitive matrix protein 1-like isoform X2 [Branchiostoma floridae]|uniref:Serine/arginine repetitive matrix protein 1-like isoform X2 n=1 Tax=Branchiostoma floridae TaxID=7739 RepID=A0A9J7KUE2_BRAFL|nr:serine/arginine repetitive matrix protein 1-like isoform X2 [Branchiostoma floridae]
MSIFGSRRSGRSAKSYKTRSLKDLSVEYGSDETVCPIFHVRYLGTLPVERSAREFVVPVVHMLYERGKDKSLPKRTLSIGGQGILIGYPKNAIGAPTPDVVPTRAVTYGIADNIHKDVFAFVMRTRSLDNPLMCLAFKTKKPEYATALALWLVRAIQEYGHSIGRPTPPSSVSNHHSRRPSSVFMSRSRSATKVLSNKINLLRRGSIKSLPGKTHIFRRPSAQSAKTATYGNGPVSRDYAVVRRRNHSGAHSAPQRGSHYANADSHVRPERPRSYVNTQDLQYVTKVHERDTHRPLPREEPVYATVNKPRRSAPASPTRSNGAPAGTGFHLSANTTRRRPPQQDVQYARGPAPQPRSLPPSPERTQRSAGSRERLLQHEMYATSLKDITVMSYAKPQLEETHNNRPYIAPGAPNSNNRNYAHVSNHKTYAQQPARHQVPNNIAAPVVNSKPYNPAVISKPYNPPPMPNNRNYSPGNNIKKNSSAPPLNHRSAYSPNHQPHSAPPPPKAILKNDTKSEKSSKSKRSRHSSKSGGKKQSYNVQQDELDNIDYDLFEHSGNESRSERPRVGSAGQQRSVFVSDSEEEWPPYRGSSSFKPVPVQSRDRVEI